MIILKKYILFSMQYSLQDTHKEVCEIINEASNTARQAFDRKKKVSFKKGINITTQIVTETDKSLDAFLRKRLREKFPEFGFITEENDNTIIKEYNWIIDPIDGTHNFALHIPVFGISVGLWKGDEPIYGIVIFPLQNETAYAMKDQGAFHNEEKLSSKNLSNEGRLTVSYHFNGNHKENSMIYTMLLDVFSSIWIFKSVTYDLYCAILGRADCCLIIHTSLWDIAALTCIAKEAGVYFEYLFEKPTLSKKDFREKTYSIAMSKKPIYAKEIIKRMRESNSLSH